MSDIVDRLRETDPEWPRELRADAADEIERLRRAVGEQTEAKRKWQNRTKSQRRKKQKAQRDLIRLTTLARDLAEFNRQQTDNIDAVLSDCRVDVDRLLPDWDTLRGSLGREAS